MLWTIIAVILSISIAQWGHFFSHMSLTGRPIFIGFITGLLLGDMKTGIIVGAQLELAFLGIVSIGATAAADAETATVMTVAFAILNKLPIETAIPLGVTIGYAASLLSNFRLLIAELFIPASDRALENDDEKKFNLICWIGSILAFIVFPSVICVTGVLAGGPVLESFVNNLPTFILDGIGAAGAMLPALGIAMILTLILNKRNAIYFFTGFVIYKYLDVDMIFMLVIGLLFALTDFFVSSEISKKKIVPVIDAEINEEEDFLS